MGGNRPGMSWREVSGDPVKVVIGDGSRRLGASAVVGRSGP
jgi:hypothetical protein